MEGRNLSEECGGSDMNCQRVGLRGESGGEGHVQVIRGMWYDIKHRARRVVKRRESTVEPYVTLSIQAKSRCNRWAFDAEGGVTCSKTLIVVDSYVRGKLRLTNIFRQLTAFFFKENPMCISAHSDDHALTAYPARLVR